VLTQRSGSTNKRVSVGYRVRAYRVEEDGRDVPLWRAVDWEPVEISVVPVGADPNARIRADQRSTSACRIIRTHPSHKRTRAMDGSPNVPTATRAPDLSVCDACQTPDGCRADEICAISGKALTEEAPPPTPEGEQSVHEQRSATTRSTDPSALVTQAVTAERTRIAGIYDAQTKLGVERKVADDLVRQGISLEDARARLIDQAAGKGQATATRPHITTGQQDERVTRKAAVENALLHRFDPGSTALSDAGREWRGLSLLELGRAFLDTEGVRTRGMSRDQVAARALHSTSDFPHILAAVANKTLRKAYEAAPRTFMPFCRHRFDRGTVSGA